MEDLNITHEDFDKICRLCLQPDDFMISIYDRVDPNPNKKPLYERIFELFHIKISRTDGLPTNICHRCLYHIEIFCNFRENIRPCETKLQYLVVTTNFKAFQQEKTPLTIADHSNSINGKLHLLPEENNIVMVIDPTKEYTSNESDSYESDAETSTYTTQVTNQRNTDSDGFKNVYFCQYCDTAYIEREECLEHESSHDQTNPHLCNFCTFDCASRNTIIAHIKECHEPEKPFICIQCNKKFGRRSDLKKHSIVHTGIRPFSCPVCSKNFSRNTNLTKHLRIHSGLKPHVCQQCPRSFSTKGDLFRHTQVHTDAKPFQCPKCPATFSRKDKFLYHERTHLKKEDAENMVISLDPFNDVDHTEEDQNTPSNFLPSNQPERTNLLQNNHIPDMSVPNHVTGDEVTFTVVNAKKDIYKPKPFICDSCTKRFTTQSSLQNHKNIHLGIRNHVCTICDKSFVRKRELDRHGVIHTGFKPYGCSHCTKKFGRKDKLVRHTRIHLEDKLFSCTDCLLTFNRKDALTLHMKIHMKEEPLGGSEIILHSDVINSGDDAGL